MMPSAESRKLTHLTETGVGEPGPGGAVHRGGATAGDWGPLPLVAVHNCDMDYGRRPKRDDPTKEMMQLQVTVAIASGGGL